MAEIDFWKMHGLGNDFIIIENRDGKIGKEKAAKLARNICRRRFSIGADGLVLVCRSTRADVKMKIFNSDGSEAEICGNGIMCFAKYCYEKAVTNGKQITVETLAGIRKILLTTRDGKVKTVKVDMGIPVFQRKRIPMLGHGKCVSEDFDVDGDVFKITCLSVGNPHCIVFVDDLTALPVSKIGPKIENHSLFPMKTNVQFAKVINSHELALRSWERGCGETLACGSGACATVVAANLAGHVDKRVTVHLPGGDLEVEYLNNLFITGSPQKAFEGRLF